MSDNTATVCVKNHNWYFWYLPSAIHTKELNMILENVESDSSDQEDTTLMRWQSK